jgi:hypothetical protein
MFPRGLLKLSPFAIASASAGRNALAQTAEPSATEGIYNVRRYGATGDGKTVDTPVINSAIEAVAAAGGGTLLFPAGTYVCFTIRLRSKVDLCLSRACTILAADSPKPGEAIGYNGEVYYPAGPARPGRRLRTTVTTTGPTPCHAFFIRQLKNLEMSHVEIAPAIADPHPVFWLEDVQRADFFGITAPSQPNFALRNVAGLHIFWSRAAKDTTLAAVTNQML